jgi:SAM-dependent methyltransferase
MNIFCSLCRQETPHTSFFERGQDWEYGVPGTFRQERCDICGLVAMAPMPNLETILSYYPAAYHGYQSSTSALTRRLIDYSLRERARMYRRLISSRGDILDVGAADGAHFDVWQTEGAWNFVGFEFNDAVAQAARNAGRNVVTASMETFDAQGKTFDLIIMNHLLEHVTDPRDTVERARALLKPGGWLVGEVPNLRSWDRMVMGRYWGGCHWPRHVHQFTPSTLQTLFRVAGFERPHFSWLLRTDHWALSVQNFLQSRTQTRVMLKHGRAWYYAPLLLLFIPLNMIQRLLHRTGVVGFRVQKPSVASL